MSAKGLVCVIFCSERNSTFRRLHLSLQPTDFYAREYLFLGESIFRTSQSIKRKALLRKLIFSWSREPSFENSDLPLQYEEIQARFPFGCRGRNDSGSPQEDQEYPTSQSPGMVAQRSIARAGKTSRRGPAIRRGPAAGASLSRVPTDSVGSGLRTCMRARTVQGVIQKADHRQ